MFCLRTPEDVLRPEKGLIVPEGRPQTPSNYIFPVKTFAIEGRQTIAKGAFGAQGDMTQWPPCLRPSIHLCKYLPKLNMFTLIVTYCVVLIYLKDQITK